AVLEDAEQQQHKDRNDRLRLHQRGGWPDTLVPAPNLHVRSPIQPVGMVVSMTSVWSFMLFQSAVADSVVTLVIWFRNTHLTLLKGKVTVMRRWSIWAATVGSALGSDGCGLGFCVRL